MINPEITSTQNQLISCQQSHLGVLMHRTLHEYRLAQQFRSYLRQESNNIGRITSIR